MIPDHLQGPWKAFILDEEGYAYRDTDELTETDWEGLQIVIVRGTAMPIERRGGVRLPASTRDEDLIWVVEDEMLLDDLGKAKIWMDRARAMAAGLNAAGQEAS